MKRIALLLLLTAYLYACQSGKPQSQAAVLSEEQMVDLMVDIRLLEGAYSYHYRTIDSSSVKIKDYYQQVFERHGTSVEQYQDSYNFYALQDGKLPELEAAIMEKLEYMQAQLETKEEK
jgi:hypothetical protein